MPNNLLPTKLEKTEFTKVPAWRKKESPEASWEFRAELDRNMPHGHPVIAGLLRKIDGGWQAKQWSMSDYAYGSHPTREAAILAIIPEVFELIEEQERVNLDKERTKQQRLREIQARQDWQDANFLTCLNINYEDEEALVKAFGADRLRKAVEALKGK